MHKYLYVIVLGCILCLAAPVRAQVVSVPEIAPIDTNYIGDHLDDLVIRLYGSNKFTRYAIGEYERNKWLNYKPNSHYNSGFGFNYRWLGVNIGFRTPGINNDFDRYGTTKYLDLQSYLYMRKLTIDLYAQTYKGYYLSNTDRILSSPVAGRPYLIRSDLHTRDIGMNAEYIFNGHRFSYRAIYLQNESQKRSAGSFLAGGGFRYVHVKGDSAIIPGGIRFASFANGQNFNRSASAALFVHGGYAHTFVIGGHFFLMGSLNVGAGVNYVRLQDEAAGTETARFNVQANGIARLGAGYNSRRYYAGVYFTTNLLHDALSIDGAWQQYETGVLRVAVARRFTLKPKTVHSLDRVFNRKRYRQQQVIPPGQEP